MIRRRVQIADEKYHHLETNFRLILAGNLCVTWREHDEFRGTMRVYAISREIKISRRENSGYKLEIIFEAGVIRADNVKVIFI